VGGGVSDQPTKHLVHVVDLVSVLGEPRNRLEIPPWARSWKLWHLKKAAKQLIQ
jgi:hypothetical protein